MANRSDIPVGRKHAISREALAKVWHCNERDTRRAIAALRAQCSKDGYAILSTAHSPSGYWRSNDPVEIAGFIRETEARARNTFIALKGAHQVLRDIERRRQYGSGFGESKEVYGDVHSSDA